MPLESCYEALERPRSTPRPLPAWDYLREQQHVIVEPGEMLFMEDWTEGVLEVTGIFCNIHDTGGQVNLYRAEGMLSNGVVDRAEFTLDDLPDPISRILIDEMMPSYPKETRNRIGAQAMHIVRMVPSDAVTPSLQIPRGLIYPDTRVFPG